MATVLTDVDPRAHVVREEALGPGLGREGGEAGIEEYLASARVAP